MQKRLFSLGLLFLAGVLFAQTPGNMNDGQWEALARSSTSLSFTDILQNPEKYKGQQVIVFGKIGQVDMREKQFVIQQLYQPKSKNFSWDDWGGMTQQGNQPGMRVYFADWHTNCSATPVGRDRVRDLSNKGQVMSPFDQERFALVAKVDLFSDTFQPYLALIDFRPARNGGGERSTTTSTTTPQSPAPVLSARAQAKKVEQERVNALDDVVKRQLRDLLLDAQAKEKAKRWAETAACCENVLIIDPANQYALAMAGAAYARIDQFELAEKHLSESVRLMPDDYMSYVSMFFVKARKGDTNAAFMSLDLANKKGFPYTFELRKDADVPASFKELPRFKQLTAISLDRLTADINGAASFQTRAIDMTVGVDDAWVAIQKVLKDQKETINVVDKENFLITTKRTAHGLLGGTYDSYFIVVEPIDSTKSRLVFKLLSFSSSVDSYGNVAMAPLSSSYAELRVEKFVSNVNKALTKKK